MNEPGLEYWDNTGGLRPGPNVESFNNVVYSTQYVIGRKIKNQLSDQDIDLYTTHMSLTEDENGLYKPKNSHDNITYKIVGLDALNLTTERPMNLLRAVIDIGPRPWDWILYSWVFGGKITRFIASFLLFIPCLQILQAVNKKEKIRPKLWDNRWKWWYLPKTLLQVDERPTQTIKTWETKYMDELQRTRHMQNDGKHIALFKLYYGKDKSWQFKLTAKLAHKIFVSRYGEEYVHGVMKRYYMDQKHPNIEVYKGIKDFLL